MRIHELAKKFHVESKDILAKIQELGGTAKNHMSLVEESVLAKLEKLFSSEKPSGAKSSKAKEVQTPSTVIPASARNRTDPSSGGKAGIQELDPRFPPKIAADPPSFVAEQHAGMTSKTETPAPSSPAPPPPSQPQAAPPSPPARTVSVRLPITVGDFAKACGESISRVIKTLMEMGIFANVNQVLNEDIVKNVAEILNVRIAKLPDEEEKFLEEFKPAEDLARLKIRPPVVTLMGHVDHGKTSLLDAIRKSNVAATEKGAITQHIGAYGVDLPGKGHVTFLDTPGHEAFTAMRARGANITDLVVLVVAADDGVMPQTVEAVSHAREARCPIMVAVNKVDLPNADIQKVLRQLQQYDLTPEAWGGKTVCVEISAKTGKGIQELLELLVLQAEILELKSNPDCEAAGTVIESHISKGSGPVATVIVQRGTLRIGDVVVSGVHMGRVRALKNDRGKNIKEASPSYAVSVMGFGGVTEAGEKFFVVQEEKTARRIAEKKSMALREADLRGSARHLALEDLYKKISEGNFKELKLIIKADVQGSMEAFSQSLEKLSNDQCQVRVIHRGIGGINESDVMLAAASDAVILGFHVKADAKAETAAQKEKVELRYYNIIYEGVEDVHKAMEGLLEPTYSEVVEGKLEIRKVFQSSKVGTIGGGYVLKGKVSRTHHARVIRNNVVLFEGKLRSLKRFKDDVRDVGQGYECGVAVEGFDPLQVGDILESYRMEKVATKLA